MTNFHIIGIKGAGTSALAQILHDNGHIVQGSDINKYFFTQKPLEEKEICIYNFSKENVKQLKNKATVITSNAYNEENNEEVKYAKDKLNLYKYHDFLGNYIKNFTSVAISGTHGKTSTTGLMSHVFKQCKPTSYLIGDGTGKGHLKSEYFIFEACEYKEHFLAYHPDYTIITNIDFDHPDFFKNEEHVLNTFQKFANNTKSKIIACGDDANCRKIKFNNVIFYGLNKENDVIAEKIKNNENGTVFDVKIKNNKLGTFQIGSHGNHTILNALAVITMAYVEGLNVEKVKEAMKTFKGVKRRFQETLINNTILIDDYAHHPTEITATLQSAKLKYQNKKIIAVFQPHTFTRTETFLKEFAKSLKTAHKVYLCEIFSSTREKEGTLTIKDLIEEIPDAKLISEKNISELLVHKNEVIVFMGAGDVQKYQAELEKKLK